MRKISILTAFVCLALCTLAQTNEEENLKKVIAKETDSYFSRDFDGWASTFLQNSKLLRTFISSYGYFPIVSWDSSRAATERDFKQYPKPQKVEIKTKNFDIRTNGNMAWVDYDQIIEYENDTIDYASHEMRLLVKENDTWKITNQVTTNTGSFNPNQPGYIENSLNTTGYVLMGAKKIDDAIEVFKLNVKLFPNAWNTYDSLAEAYAAAGNKKLAIENYEKSIKLNPKSESGPPALAKLKAK